MRIAIIGSGVSGLVAAHHLHPHHDLTVFEADDRIGGHANTVRIELPGETRDSSGGTGHLPGETHDVDTGFIVYNRRNYPVFSALLDELGVSTQPSEMSLAVQDERTGLEWGTNVRRMFAQPRNALRPGFVAMIGEILRWNRLGNRLLAGRDTQADDPLEAVGDFLARHRFSRRFLDWYLVPLAAALWSADPTTVDRFPAVTMCRFLANHGMLSTGDRPAWRTVTGGSRQYVTALTAPYADRMRTGTPVGKVHRHADGIDVQTVDGATESFDRVVMALHSTQALELLSDADRTERDILGALRYQPNVATLHTDRRMLPTLEKTWASWNVHVRPGEQRAVSMTYFMNRLQSLESRHPICVTLNRHADIDPAKVLARFDYEHPVFDAGAIAAQGRRAELQGRGGLYWSGAYWGFGFHEDGARSGAVAARAIDEGR